MGEPLERKRALSAEKAGNKSRKPAAPTNHRDGLKPTGPGPVNDSGGVEGHAGEKQPGVRTPTGRGNLESRIIAEAASRGVPKEPVSSPARCHLTHSRPGPWSDACQLDPYWGGTTGPIGSAAGTGTKQEGMNRGLGVPRRLAVCILSRPDTVGAGVYGGTGNVALGGAGGGEGGEADGQVKDRQRKSIRILNVR